MMAKSFIALVASFILINAAFSQTEFKSEEELKSQAQKLFDERKLIEAAPLFAQLLSLYPQDPNYNYKYGATLLSASADREKPMKFLKFAISKSSQVEPLAYYFLGKAHHLNYNFADAVKFYSRFKQKADKSLADEFMVDRQIEMAKNGNELLSKLNEVQVLDKQVISRKDFFRIYELEGIDGKVIVKPEEFMTKYDQKVGDKSVMYLPANASEVYFSSYGKKGENGRDIFKTVKLGNRSWSDPVNLGPSINTPYDENYPFIHPDGRTLYFASKGHSSMGGYDLFMSVYDESTAAWKAPVNLDFAFSSVDDDILFITDKNKVLAYFASSRANEADEITVYKVMVEKAPAELSVIKGKFIAENNPDLKKAKITVIDSKTKQTVGIYETDSDGNYQVEIASNGGLYRFNVETTSDAPIHTGEVDIPRQDKFEVLGQELRLVGEGDNQTLVIKNIFDGTVAQNTSGPSISSQTLRQKALLDINFSEDALAELSKRNTAAAQSSSEPNATAESSNENQTSNELASTDTDQGSETADSQLQDGDVQDGQQTNPNNASSEKGSSSGSVSGSGAIPSTGAGGVIAGGAVAAAALSPEQKQKKKEELNTRLGSVDEALSSRSSKMQAQANEAYSKAFELKAQSDQAFQEAGINPNEDVNYASLGEADIPLTKEQSTAEGEQSDELPSDEISTRPSSQTEGSEESDQLVKARELASRAAITAALAQKLEIGAQELNGIDRQYNTEERSNIENQINSEQFESAEASINAIQNQTNSVRTTEVYLEKYDQQLQDAIDSENESIELEREKLVGLKKERSRIDSNISTLQEEIASSSSADSAKIRQADELKLDRNDIDFQIDNLTKSLATKEAEIAALSLEQEEIGSLRSNLSEVDASAANTSEGLSPVEKNSLIEELKLYRDNGQLAYSPKEAGESDYLSPAEIYQGDQFASTSLLIERTGKGMREGAASGRDLSALESRSVSDIEVGYVANLEQARSNPAPDQELQIAKEIAIYDNWITELSDQQALRRDQLSKSSDETEKQQLQDELNQLSIALAEKQNEKKALQASISGGELVLSQTSPSSSQSAGEIDGSVGNDQSESSNNTSSGSITAGSISEQNNDLAESNNTASSGKSAEELAEELGPIDLSEVQANSPYPEGLNDFNFDKSYNYNSVEASPSLKSVKTSLYQAKEYKNRAEAARAAAYTLPTVEERREAFESVNEYEEAAERLQRQAISDVGAVNQQEFYRNASILNNVNSYDQSEIESSNLDLAILLEDEAETYFNKAQVVRQEANSVDLSDNNQRLKLQKAYDLELLALNKQKQALESLKLVDADIETASVASSTDSKFKNSQIQTITDTAILAIEDASVAKAAADSIVKRAEVLEVEAAQIRKDAEVQEVGPKRDSLMAIYEAKQDSAIQLRSDAAVYYEREKQIESGFEAEMAYDAGIVKPALIFTQSYDIDTVNVDEERERTVLESKEYKAFSAASKENQQMRIAARIEYDKAVELRKKQFELDRQAQVILASASNTDDPAEKERRVKQAQVIEQRARKLDDSIDSLNKLIRVKNYLVQTSEAKMKNSIASLSATQQAEIVYLMNREVDITSTDLDYSEFAQLSEGNQERMADLSSGEESTESSSTGQSTSSSSSSSSAGKVLSSNSDQAGSKAVLSPAIPVTTRKSEEAIEREKESNLADDGVNSSSTERGEVLRDGTVNPNEIIRSAPRRPISLANIDKVPKTVKEPIFIKLGLNESAYGNDKPIPTLNELPEGIVYKVQVGAFRNPIPQDLFKGFAPLSAETGPNGITRYTAGLFNNERVAVAARDEIRNFGYKDAFVVAFRNGQRISISSARSSSETSTASNNTPIQEFESVSSNNNISSSTEASRVDFGDNVRDIQSIDELFFTVQIGVYSKEVKAGTFDAYSDLNAIKLPVGLIRYNSGVFNSVEEASEHMSRIKVSIPDAYVVAYYNGKRISIDQAARIMNQN